MPATRCGRRSRGAGILPALCTGRVREKVSMLNGTWLTLLKKDFNREKTKGRTEHKEDRDGRKEKRKLAFKHPGGGSGHISHGLSAHRGIWP